MKYNVAKVKCTKEEIKNMLDMISVTVHWTTYSKKTNILSILINTDDAETVQTEVLDIAVDPVTTFEYAWEDYPYEMHNVRYALEGETVVRYTNTCGYTEGDCWDTANEIREETSLSEDDFEEILEDVLSDKRYVLTELN